MGFILSEHPIDPDPLEASLRNPRAGACVTFEGWVRNHHEGRNVDRLEYEAYPALAEKQGNRIVAEAVVRFRLEAAQCVHRIGRLDIGDVAVWVGVSSPHRAEAFDACRYIIDEVKRCVPIWKKEFYSTGESGWVNCHRCSAEHTPNNGDGAEADRERRRFIGA